MEYTLMLPGRTLISIIAFLLLTFGLPDQATSQPSTPQEETSFMYLIPQPKQVTPGKGVFHVTSQTRLFLPAPCEQPEFLAAQRLQALLKERAGVTPILDRLGFESYPGSAILLQVAANASSITGRAREAYSLEITPERVTIKGNTAAGVYSGLMTLTQLVRQYGAKLPVCSIADDPDFEFRGFYHDVSRGKVPTLETLKWLVDYLTERKVNQFQLYIEHPFMFRFNPAIAQNPDGLTSEEILILQEYCRDRRIDFVPSLQSFGHMAGVLSLPEYRKFADVEPTKDFHEMTWMQRMKGATINMSDPEALALIDRLNDHFLPLFDSPYINFCADETYDLGEGRNKELAQQQGKARLYLQHINHLNALAKKYNKQMMFWGDIVKQHPESVPDIPKDTILLNWGYSATTDFESTKLFADAGLKFYVCPGVSGWNRFINDINNADLNIRRYAATGRKYGALGLLNTDWGDHGHYNLLGGSLHGIALGAAMAWNTEGPDSKTFDHIWNMQTFGKADDAAVQSLRAQSLGSSTWTVFYAPFADVKKYEWAKVNTQDAETLIREGNAGAKLFDKLAKEGGESAWIAEEYAHGSRMNALLGEKILIWEQLNANAGKKNKKLAKRLKEFAKECKKAYAEYPGLWLARNKHSELGDIDAHIDALIADAKRVAKELGD